jgi:hypothetical protein
LESIFEDIQTMLPFGEPTSNEGNEKTEATVLRSARNHVTTLHPLRWISNHLEEIKQSSKMAAAPTMVVALIFSDYWAKYFKEFMYIVAILAHFSATPGFPRAKLINFNFPLVILLAVAYCWSLLGGYCAIKAREARGELGPYSPSASAILAIFLMVGCWMSYAGRAAFPKQVFPWILVGIYFVATVPSLVEMQTMDQVIYVTSLVLECFYTGMAVGMAVGLFIFPRSSRVVFMKAVEDSLLALSSVVKAQPGCLGRLALEIGTSMTGVDPVRQMKDYIASFTAASTKVKASLGVAGQEWTWSRYNRSDLEALSDQLTMISAPLIGLRSLADSLILVLTEEWSEHGEEAADEHREFVTTMKRSAEELTVAIDNCIDHALARIGSRASRTSTSPCVSGECEHLAAFEETLSKHRSLTGELTEKGEHYLLQQIHRDTKGGSTRLPYSALLGCFFSSHFLLLLSATGHEFHSLLLFLEEKSHKKKQIYTPLHNLFTDTKHWLNGLRRDAPNTHMHGLVFSRLASSKLHDVDHLPAANMSEKIGDAVRKAWKVFASPSAGFGVRGVLAIMSIAILAFLKDEHKFYDEQRFLWALFSIILCLDRTAGSSTLRLLFRFFATFTSMVASYIIWYIVDQKTAGIIVFLFLWYWILSYHEMKSQKYGPAAFTAVVAATVMIANQLQIRKLGASNVAVSGQAVYASYIIFPLRLAQVTLGIFVAYFWTLFPSPLPEHTELRHAAGDTLLNLATFSTSIHQSVAIQFGGHGELDAADRHLDRLHGRHRAHLTEHNMLIGKMQSMMKTIPYEFNLGGKFPLKTYKAIFNSVARLGELFTLVGYISHTLDGSKLASQMNTYNADVQSHLCPPGISTRLVILCSALRNGHPLPPGMRTLQVPDLRHFLHKRVATDASFASASLIHSANYMITRNLNELTK